MVRRLICVALRKMLAGKSLSIKFVWCAEARICGRSEIINMYMKGKADEHQTNLTERRNSWTLEVVWLELLRSLPSLPYLRASFLICSGELRRSSKLMVRTSLNGLLNRSPHKQSTNNSSQMIPGSSPVGRRNTQLRVQSSSQLSTQIFPSR
jgi:hypothetical protein